MENKYFTFNHNHKRHKVYLKDIETIDGIKHADYTLYCCSSEGYHYENCKTLKELKEKYKKYYTGNYYGYGLIPCYVVK